MALSRSWLAAAVICSVVAGAGATGPPVPTFPKELSYSVTMYINEHGNPPNSNFTGYHYASTSLNKVRVDWSILFNQTGPEQTFIMVNQHDNPQVGNRVRLARATQSASLISQKTAAARSEQQSSGTRSADTVLVSQSTMIGPGAPTCSYFNYSDPIFDEDWASAAHYEGLAFFDGRLCRKWSNVKPYVVQAPNTPRDFYADYFTGMPVGYSAPWQTMTYGRDITLGVPDAGLFDVSGGDLACKPGPPGDHSSASWTM